MNIVLDLGHPAHVHYFKNFIWIMEANGHSFLVISRDKEITIGLLKAYGIDFVNRGKGGKKALSKLLYIPKGDWIVYKHARKFKADLFMSFGSPYAAHASFLMGKPHIAFDDTESAFFGHLFYKPFTDVFVNPKSFNKDFGPKQIRFDSFMELTYTHPKYRNNNVIDVKSKLGIKPDDRFAVLRFVSWAASHDMGHNGISPENRAELIKLLNDKGYRVFISSEYELEDEFKKYELETNIDEIHDVLSAADFFIGESGTMAAEATFLGTPALLVTTLNAGVWEELVKLKVLYKIDRYDSKALSGFISKYENESERECHAGNLNDLFQNKEDITQLMINLAEEHGPASS